MEKGWVWNPRWSNLEFKAPEYRALIREAMSNSSAGNSVSLPGAEEPELPGLPDYEQWSEIVRFDTTYEIVPGQARFGFYNEYIVPVTEGYEWRNRLGDWISYDADGRVLKYGSIDNEFTIERDSQKRIVAVVDKFDQQLYRMTYAGSAEQPSSVQDYAGRTVSYGYTQGRLTSVTDVRGYTWHYAYDGDDNLKSRTDPLGNLTQYHIDDGLMTRITRANGDVTQFEYKYFDSRTGDTVRYGTYILNKILPDQTVVKVQVANVDRPGGVGRIGNTGSSGGQGAGTPINLNYAYNLYERSVNGETVAKTTYIKEVSKRRRKIFSRGETVEYEEDIGGNKTKFQYQDGRIETVTYHTQLDLPIERTDAKGILHRYAYDAGGRVLQYTQSFEDESRSYSYAYSDTQRTASLGGRYLS